MEPNTFFTIIAAFIYLLLGTVIIDAVCYKPREVNDWDANRPYRSTAIYILRLIFWLPFLLVAFIKYRFFTAVFVLLIAAVTANAQTSPYVIKYPNGVNYWVSCSGPAKHSSATLYSTTTVTVKSNTSFVITAFSADMDVLATTTLEGATVTVCGGMLKVTDREGFVYLFYDKARPQ